MFYSNTSQEAAIYLQLNPDSVPEYREKNYRNLFQAITILKLTNMTNKLIKLHISAAEILQERRSLLRSPNTPDRANNLQQLTEKYLEVVKEIYDFEKLTLSDTYAG